MKKSFNRENILGFTLIELMVTVIIIGILAGFVIRGFERTIDGARQKEAKINLLAIKTAETLYYNTNGAYYPPGGTVGCSQINSALSLNIIENPNSVTYACTNTNGYTCTATYMKNLTTQWTYAQTPVDDIPICTPGAMPCS